MLTRSLLTTTIEAKDDRIMKIIEQYLLKINYKSRITHLNSKVREK
jgi:hypothetical protein